MMDLDDRVRRAIRTGGLLRDGDRVAVAVSGGADSVALACLLTHMAASAAWRVAGLIHVHHGLRGAEADADANFVRGLAARLGVPVVVKDVDVPAARASERGSLEATARRLRYQAFAEAASALEANRVATGHTADDQAETVLLRLLRGAGLRGAAGIRVRRGPYVRPLLQCRRDELRTYLERTGQSHRDDTSNADLSIPRNRLRHGLMRAITADWPGGVAALARFADLAAADEDVLRRRAARIFNAQATVEPGRVALPVAAVAGRPVAVARRVIRTAIETVGGEASQGDIERVRTLLTPVMGPADVEGAFDIAGVRVRRTLDACEFSSTAAVPAPPTRFDYLLPVPGSVVIAETGAALVASLSTGAAAESPTYSPVRQVVPVAAVSLPLRVRSRRPGDRFRPLGAPGSRKLKDVLVDRKIAPSERDRVPVIVDARGRIVWVAGVAVSEECRVTTPVGGMVILELKKGTQ